MNGRRLALVTARYWPHMGEHELFLSGLAEELTRLGVAPVVVTGKWSPGWPDRIEVREVPVCRVAHAPRGGWSTFRYLSDLSRWFRDSQATLAGVYVQGLRHEAHAILGGLRGSNVPIVLRCHDSGPAGDCVWHATVTGGDRIRRRAREAAAVVAAWESAADELVAAGFDSARVQVIPPGCAAAPPRTPDRRFRARAALADANHDLHVAEYAPVTVCVGRLNDLVALSHLLDAWGHVARRWPSSRLWLIGDGPARGALYEQIVDLDLQCQVFMPGSFENLADIWLAADACVVLHPTTEYQLMLGAMSAGLPVVAADTSVSRQLVQHEQTGLLVPAGDRDAWREALSHLWDYPSRTLAMGNAARALVAQKFSPQAAARLHVELFDRLLAGRARTP